MARINLSATNPQGDIVLSGKGRGNTGFALISTVLVAGALFMGGASAVDTVKNGHSLNTYSEHRANGGHLVPVSQQTSHTKAPLRDEVYTPR